MSYTPFNAPLLSGLLGDMQIAAQFSVKADLDSMLMFQAALAQAQASTGLIPQDHAAEINRACQTFETSMADLQEGVVRDGMAVPEFIRQLRETCGGEAGASLHLGSTSQDAIDTSLVLRLVRVNSILRQRLKEVLVALERIEGKFGTNELMARTRMQAALPITVGDRLHQWRLPVENSLNNLDRVESALNVVQLGGPVGDLAGMEGKGEAVRAELANVLALRDPGCVWHTDRSRIADYCNWMTSLASALGKIGQDAALMAQNEIGDLALEGAGGSSAMAHKQNPVKAEALITLARFVSTQNAGMNHNLIHEQERSGASWTFEWMVLPQLCVATGASLTNALSLLKSIKSMGRATD